MKADIARRQARGVRQRRRPRRQGVRLRHRRRHPLPADHCSLVTRKEVVEADIVREVFARVLAGEGIRHIAADLRARGITTTAGKPMHPLAVRRMVACAPVRRAHARRRITPRAWQPVVDREDWETVERRPGQPAGPAGASTTPAGTCCPASPAAVPAAARCKCCPRTPRRQASRSPPGTGAWCRPAARCSANWSTSTPTSSSAPSPSSATSATPPAASRPRRHWPPSCAPWWKSAPTIEAAVTDHTKGRLHLLLGRLDSIDPRLAQLRELTAADAAARSLPAPTPGSPRRSSAACRCPCSRDPRRRPAAPSPSCQHPSAGPGSGPRTCASPRPGITLYHDRPRGCQAPLCSDRAGGRS